MTYLQYDKSVQNKQCVKCGLIDYTSDVICFRCQGELKKIRRKPKRRTTASKQKSKDKKFGKRFRW